MRYARIFLLHLQDALDDKARMFVWFLISLINPLVLMVFWKGASGSSQLGDGWNFTAIVTYYMLMVIANTFLNVHIEENIAFIDIQEGYLANYLIKPVSYIKNKFFHELPYRIIESFFGLLFLIIFYNLFKINISVPGDLVSIGLLLLVFLLAYFISFLFKMVMGLTSLWTTDYSGMSQLVGVIIIIAGGFILPIKFFPEYLQNILYALPFPYIFYFPVTALLGEYTSIEMMKIIGMQFFWITMFFVIYKYIWHYGVQKFTAVGR